VSLDVDDPNIKHILRKAGAAPYPSKQKMRDVVLLTLFEIRPFYHTS